MKTISKILIASASIPLFASVCALGASPIPAMAEGEASSSSVSSDSVSVEASSAKDYDATITTQVGFTSDGAFALDTSRGVVDVSKSEGKIGDVITFAVYGNPSFNLDGSRLTVFKYKVTEVLINTTIVTAKEGIYSFTIEKDIPSYVIEAKFDEFDNLKVTDLSTINWAGFFTVDNILNLLTWVMMLFLSSGFIISIIRSKKYKQITQQQIVETVTSVVDKVLDSKVKDYLDKTMVPVMNAYNLNISDISKTMTTLLKCFTLSQEDTPEARLAIADELTKLKNSDAETTEKVKKIVNEAIAERDAKQEANKQAIQDAREATNGIKTSEDTVPEVKEDNGGKVLPTE